MNICYACNQNFKKYLYTSIYSLLYYNETYVNKIYLLYNDFQDKDLKFIFDLTQKFKFEFQPIKVDITSLNNLKLTHHFSIETYFRLLIDKYIEDDKLLYLDADTVINGTLEDLDNINVDDYLLAAVVNPGISLKYKSNLLMDEDKPYFNAGFIMMNLELIKQENLFEKVIGFINKYPNKINLVDQDAFNAILNGDFKILPLKYNTLTNKGKVSFEPIVIHYAGGSSKPLKLSTNNNYHSKFLHFYRLTPYYKFLITDIYYLKNNILYTFYYRFKSHIRRSLVLCLKKDR